MKENFCKYSWKPCRSKEGAEQKALEKDMRSYKCESCGFWHLTSQPLITSTKFEAPQKHYEEVDYG